jgi:hypothetical protein
MRTSALVLRCYPTGPPLIGVRFADPAELINLESSLFCFFDWVM